MNKYSEIVQKIIDTYEKNLFTFDSKHQYHYALRRFRVTGDQKYIRPISSNFQNRTIYYYPRLVMFAKNGDLNTQGIEMLASMHSNHPRNKARIEVFNKNPEALFITKLAHYLFLAKSFEMDQQEYFRDIFGDVIQRLFDQTPEQYLYTDEMIKTNYTAISNTIFYLKYIGLDINEQKLLDTYLRYWIGLVPQNSTEWQNKIYGLTHIIIADSYFYQRYVENAKYKLLLEFIENNLNEIIANTNMDIISEVGLAMKLCNYEGNGILDKIKEHVVSSFSYEKGYIPRESSDNILKAEHRNSVALLLLGDYQQFFKGPNLPLYFKNQKKKFVLPIESKVLSF